MLLLLYYNHFIKRRKESFIRKWFCWPNEKMANITIKFSRLETALRNNCGHNFTLLSYKTAGLKSLAFAENFDTKKKHGIDR